jgi:hypothetical protein
MRIAVGSDQAGLGQRPLPVDRRSGLSDVVDGVRDGFEVR